MRITGQCSSNVDCQGKFWNSVPFYLCMTSYSPIISNLVEYSFPMKHNWEVFVWDLPTNLSFLFFQQMFAEHLRCVGLQGRLGGRGICALSEALHLGRL